MKKVLISILCVAVLAALYACSNSDSGGEKTDPVPSGGGQGITVNDIPFERVEIDEMPEDIRDKVDQAKSLQGFDILQSGEVSYLVVYAGERPTGGYSIEITSIVDQEGITEVTVKEKAPGKDVMVTQALTYPFDIAKLELGISGNVKLFFVSDGNG